MILTKLLLFTDGSVHVRSGIGYGAFLLVSDDDFSPDSLKKKIQVKRFESTSSTRLELQVFLWALGKIDKNIEELTVYSDSQNLSGLLTRRQRLEQNNFHSKTKRPLKNTDLYQVLFTILDKYKIQFVKVKGHKPSKEKNSIDRIFSLVDRASRKALRNEIRE